MQAHIVLFLLFISLVSSFALSMKPSSSITFETLHEKAALLLEGKPSDPRTQVLRLGELVGNLCSSFMTNAPMDPHREKLLPGVEENRNFPPTLEDDEFWSQPSIAKDDISNACASLMFGLFVASTVCDINLHASILKKMELNGRKYPVELCKGKSGKYTAYSNETGITKTQGQSTVDSPTKAKNGDGHYSNTRTFDGMMKSIREFAMERKWNRYHTPRNIVLALMGELGELAELFQWHGDAVEPQLKGWTDEERDHVEQEFADVSIYLLRLCDVCNIDVGRFALSQAQQETSM